MRAAELLGSAVRDDAGTSRGTVLDIRIVREPGSPDPGAWHIDGVVVGRRTSLARLGYSYGAVETPLWLAALGRRLGNHLRFVPWNRVALRDGVVQVSGSFDNLVHPSEVQ